MRNATSGSGTTSAVMARAPMARIAESRCMPLGVRKPSASGTAMIGSRKRPTFGITPASLSACAGDSSRWYGVGCTASMGNTAIATQCPCSGSRYWPMTTPSALRTSSQTAASSADGVPSTQARASRPALPGSASFLVFLGARGARGFLTASVFGLGLRAGGMVSNCTRRSAKRQVRAETGT